MVKPSRDSNLTEAELYQRIRTKYGGDEWATFRNVADQTGAARAYADAIAVNLWKSRGHAIHGFEIKVSRSDWLRELKKPAKAETIASRCNFWWLVVADLEIVKEGELPDGWGLMYPRAGGLSVAVKAEKRAAGGLTLPFLAAILRRAQEQSPEAEDREARDSEIRRRAEELAGVRIQQAERAIASRIRSAESEVDAYRETLAALNRGLGPFNAISPWGWHPERFERLEELGRLTAASIRGEDVRLEARRIARKIQEEATRILETVNASLERMEADDGA